MRRCYVCREEKEDNQFNRRGTGYQRKCRACSKRLSNDHYLANKDLYKRRVAKRKQTLSEAIDAIKARTPCADCGNKFHPCAMDFDHLDATQKIADVSRLRSMNVNMKRILDEIAKCELVCANCHRIRTYNRHRRNRI